MFATYLFVLALYIALVFIGGYRDYKAMQRRRKFRELIRVAEALEEHRQWWNNEFYQATIRMRLNAKKPKSIDWKQEGF